MTDILSNPWQRVCQSEWLLGQYGDKMLKVTITVSEKEVTDNDTFDDKPDDKPDDKSDDESDDDGDKPDDNEPKTKTGTTLEGPVNKRPRWRKLMRSDSE